jgi:hypothetical protein
MGGVLPSPRVACSADFGGEQEQPIEQVRRARDLLTVAADEQVEEQPPGGAECEARMGLGLLVGNPDPAA